MGEHVSFRIDARNIAKNDPLKQQSGESENHPNFPFTRFRYIIRQFREETAEQVLSKVGRGTWFHATFHLATAILSPAAYAPLPEAMASLGWPAGFGTLVIGTAVALYCSVVLASLWEWDGVKYVRYRDLAQSIFGKPGYYAASLFQEIASVGKTVIICIAAGRSLEVISHTFGAESSFTLQEFISLFGLLQLALSQAPDIHSMRWLNAVCTISSMGFAATAVGLLLHNGTNLGHTVVVDHDIRDKKFSEPFAIFTALGVVAFSLGDAVLPEIQSTVQEPCKQNMFKAISTTYALTIITLWTYAFAGYRKLDSTVSAYPVDKNAPWQIALLHSFGVLQMSGCFQIYCRPTYSFFEAKLLAVEGGPFTLHKCLMRLFATSLYIAVAIIAASAMPFYGSLVSLIGAIGFAPIDVVIPLIAGLRASKNKENRSCLRWTIHIVIAVVYSLIATVGAICAVKFVALEACRHKFFYNY